MLCPNCGEELNGNSKFCSNCGEKMENETNVVKINEVKTPKNNNKQIINALTVVVIILAVISIHLILNSVIQLEIFLLEGFALVSTNGNIILC